MLNARPLFKASNRDQIAQALQDAYRVKRIDFAGSKGQARAVANRVQIPGLHLHYCRYDAPTEMDFADMAGFRQMFNLSGQGELRAEGRVLPIDENSSALMPPDCDFTGVYGGGYAHLVVQYDERALAQKWEQISGRSSRRPLALPALERLSAPSVQRTRSVAIALASQFDATSRSGPIAVAELSQALMISFLWEHLTDLDSPQECHPQASSSEASRLEEYMHANWDRPLTIEAVAAACGVSVRSVFAQFKRSRGVSPMAYLREVRLNHARTALASDSNASVIDVGMACGFQSLGHFARRYRERFGELPSATLKRSAPKQRP